MQTTLFLPATLAELENLLRATAAGRFPEALHGSSPPLVALPPAGRRTRAASARAPVQAPMAR